MSLSRHSAPGPNAGFSYQFDRALHWLAASPAGAVIGIETDDDVAVRRSDGSTHFEQDKHSIRDAAQPFGDRSKDLWHTLAIWLDAIEGGEIAIATAGFHLVTNKLLPDCIATRLGGASSESDIAACLADLDRTGTNPPETISQLVRRVLRPESRDALRDLIANTEVCDASTGASGVELRRKTIATLQLPAWCANDSGSILDELSGWLHNTTLALWQNGEPAWVSRDHFVNQLHAVLDRRKRQVTRERAEHLIPIATDRIGHEKGRPFVKQLHLISDDDAVVDTSIREYIRCNIEKSRLSKEGDVTDADWEAFEDVLLSRWNKIRARVIRMDGSSPEEDVGFKIFTETTESHREKLAGADTEQVYLTSGTYHRMADLLRVGWHPRYEKLMEEFLKAQ